MKELLIVLFLFAGFNLQAQKEVEKEITYNREKVEMNFEFASYIEVRTWHKPRIRI